MENQSIVYWAPPYEVPSLIDSSAAFHSLLATLLPLVDAIFDYLEPFSFTPKDSFFHDESTAINSTFHEVSSSDS